jgi:integrase
MTRVRLRHVTADRDRHGNVRYYFRKRGLKSKIRLPALPGSEEFMRAYEALLAGRPLPQKNQNRPIAAKASSGSLRWLFDQYLAIPEFKQLDVKTRNNRNRILSTICALRISDTNPGLIGEVPFAELTTKHIRRIRDRKAETPQAANDWLKSLKVVFKWAVEAEFVMQNPAKDVPKIKAVTQGFHTWSIEDVTQFEATHPLGTMPRLALALLLYTGQRRSDVILFGPEHIRDGWLRFTQQKNRNLKPVALEIPVLPVLAGMIASTKSGPLTFLVSKLGKAFTHGGFGNRFREWCDLAGLPHCSAHGLRKAGATRAAENGATAPQLMAIFGWSDIKQAELYIRAAEQKRLAKDSMHLLHAVHRT